MDVPANVILILDRASTVSPQSMQFCGKLSFNSYQLFISYDATKPMKSATLPLKSLLEIQVLLAELQPPSQTVSGKFPWQPIQRMIGLMRCGYRASIL